MGQNKLMNIINETLMYCSENVEFYKKRLRKIVGSEGITSMMKFENIPFTTKDDVRKFYSYGFKGADIEDIVAYNESAGTSSSCTGNQGTRAIDGNTCKGNFVEREK